jgi:hypothetical protein
VPATGHRSFQGFRQARHIPLATYQRRLPGGRRLGELGRRGGWLGGDGSNWLASLRGAGVTALAQDLVIESLRLGFRFRSELPLERGHAELILAQRRAPPPRLDVELHQCPVHGLLKWIELQQSQRGPHRGVGRAGGPLGGEKLGQRPQGHVAQALSMAKQPVLERRLRDREPIEEITLIQGRRSSQRRGGRLGRAPLELVHIDRHRLRIEGHRLAVQRKGVKVGGAKALPERVQRLPQAGARSRLGRAPPEEGRQHVSGMRRARRHREVGEEGPRFPGGKGKRGGGLEARSKAAQKCQNQQRHRVSVSPGLTIPRPS